jgi:hypothetical protein
MVWPPSAAECVSLPQEGILPTVLKIDVCNCTLVLLLTNKEATEIF